MAWLGELSEDVGIGPFAFDEAGVCRLVGDDGHHLSIAVEEGDQTLSLRSPILDLAGMVPTVRADRLEACLARNLFSLETRGTSLGLDERTGSVLITYRVYVLALDPVSFRNLVASFVGVAADLRRTLGDAGSDPAQNSIGEAR